MSLPWSYLVFSGGGIRAFTFLGVLNVMAQVYPRYLSHEIKGAAGTSAGAFMALMIILGFTPLEMFERLLSWSQTVSFQTHEMTQFTEKWGLFNKQVIVDFLQLLLHEKTGHAHLTLAELYEWSGHKELTLCAVQIRQEIPVFFMHRTHPQVKVWQAVLASLSVPILFSPTQIDEDWYIDGGILCNLPVDTFTEPVLAFQLRNPVSKEMKDWKEYILNIFYLPMNHANRLRLQNVQIPHHILNLHTGNFSSFEFTLSETQKRQLFWFGIHYGQVWLRPLVWQTQMQSLLLEQMCVCWRELWLSAPSSKLNGTTTTATTLDHQIQSPGQQEVTHHQTCTKDL